jgi:predicted nucleic acid-binding Zn ribbon protein
MDQRQCAKCKSSVDAAKAFCPECGNSMEIEVQRQTTTEFNLYDGTEKITRSAYNIMIKEMDLDISESPPMKETAPKPAPQIVAEKPPKSKTTLWIIIGVVAFVFLMVFILVIAGVFFYMR